MSEWRQLLVPLADTELDEALVRFAVRLAQVHSARVTAVLAVPACSLGAFLSAETAAAAAVLRRQDRDRSVEKARERVQRVAAMANCPVALEICNAGAPRSLMARMRTSDLTVMASPSAAGDPASARGSASRCVLDSGCPLLFVPPPALDSACGSRVLVAWSETRESARALRDALPLLRAAQHVELLKFVPPDAGGGAAHPAHPQDLPGLDDLRPVRDHLAAHGVQAQCSVRTLREVPFAERLLRPDTIDASIGDLLLSHAADTQADLIVMGGYGNPRALEVVLGGVTRTILSTMTVPVLMSH